MGNFQSNVVGPIGGNSDGSVPISIENKYTYRYAALANTPAATPTDFITIQGAAGRTVKIKSIRLGGIATTAGLLTAQIVRRSAANTTGTFSAVAAVKHDVNDPSPLATVNLYTVNPGGLGTLVGPLAVNRVWLPLTTSQNAMTLFDFSTRMDKALVLRGISDFICINFNGAAVPAGGVLDFEIETEEDAS